MPASLWGLPVLPHLCREPWKILMDQFVDADDFMWMSGKHKSAAGPAACADCPSGTYSPTSAAAASNACLACPSDSSSPAGSAAAAACACNAVSAPGESSAQAGVSREQPRRREQRVSADLVYVYLVRALGTRRGGSGGAGRRGECDSRDPGDGLIRSGARCWSCTKR